jgi:DNA-binding beta-propeller fold protein YncE
MTKRTTGVVLAAVAGAAAVAAVIYVVVSGNFGGPPAHPQAKSQDGGQAAPPEEPDDPSLYKPAPVSLSAAVAGRNKVQRWRAAVLRGRVAAADGKGLDQVRIGMTAQDQSSQTQTDAEGRFDLAVNGGGPVEVVCEKTGYLPVRRRIAAPWQDYVWLPDIVLVPAPANAGAVELPWAATEDGAAPAVRGAIVADGSPHEPTFLAPPNLTAEASIASRAMPLKGKLSLAVREYGAGPRGASALPASPPPRSGLVYAIEVVADAGEDLRPAGGRNVVFNPYLVYYVENFLKLPVGAELPTWRYDAEQSLWRPGLPGRVVRVGDFTKGLDAKSTATDGDQRTTAPAAGGPSVEEQKTLRRLYTDADQTLWRLPLTETGSWAVFFPLRPPEGAVTPPPGLASVAADAPDAPQSPPAAVSVPISGTPFLLDYRSDRTQGMKALSKLDIALSGPTVPKGLRRIDLEVQIAGERHAESFPPNANQKAVFQWNGLDVYGRPVAGRRPATVRVGYVYDAKPPALQECILWQEQRLLLGGWDARASALGGWTLNIHHAYDPIGRILYLGDGGRRDGSELPLLVTTVAGGTPVPPDYNDDDQPAVQAHLSDPQGLAVGPDCSLYISDAGQHRIRRVKPDGLIVTAAGDGVANYNGEEGRASEVELNGPTGLAFGPDGSLYIADDGNDRVRRLSPNGKMRVIAGRGLGKLAYSGDGGPALDAQMNLLRGLAVGPDGDVYVAQNGNEQCVRRIAPDGRMTCLLGGPAGNAPLRTANAVAAAPDGAVYVADGDGCRVWRIEDQSATVVAGTGAPGFSGDGGPAEKAQLNAPSGLALGPDGGLYIADAGNQRVPRVAPDGVITTVAGCGKSDARDLGDGGPALSATLGLSTDLGPGQGRLCGLAVGPDGDLYVADAAHGSVRRIAPAFDGISDSEILLTSEDGKELYVFDGFGRHLKTLDAATGAVIYRFVYDAAWRLKEIHDGANAVTKIERKGGRPTALIAPDGKRTTLETGDDSRISRIVFPGGEAATMEYDAGGLLTSFRDARGNVAHYHYANDGRLAAP